MTASLKRLDATGHFEGWASLFNIADTMGDIVAPGAFTASLMRRGVRGVRMLWQHDVAEPIGAWKALVETPRGLYARGCLNLAVQRGRELFALLSQGGIDGLSIGFKAMRAHRDSRGKRRLLTVDLWEISLVTFPMLPGARVLAVERAASSPADG